MIYMCIIITAFTICLVLAVIFKLNIKQNKNLAEDEELNSIAKKFPNNIEICKRILKKLDNENVQIEEDTNAKDCLYIAITNKIIIAGTQTNFTRIQTIAHECIHSIQERRIQLSNFIISNIRIVYFIICSVLVALKIIPEEYKITVIVIYMMISFMGYVLRVYLENDAMIRARYIAEEYILEQNKCQESEIRKILNGFDKINNMGIKGVNYSLMLEICIKIIFITLIMWIF